MQPFARTIDAAKKYVVSSTLDRVDWNAELVRGDLTTAVQQLKRESGKGLLAGGVKLPLALAELGLIDEYEFVVQPRLAGRSMLDSGTAAALEQPRTLGVRAVAPSLFFRRETMWKVLVASAALAFLAVSGAPAFAAKAGKSQTWAEKRGHCINQARGEYTIDKGRGWRSRFRACMVQH